MRTWVVLVGSVVQGISVVGPFVSAEDAIFWAERNCQTTWEVTDMDKPYGKIGS